MTTNTNTNTNTIMRRHVEALTSMLLLGRKMEPGVAILAGEPLDMDGRLWLGQSAAQTGMDLIHCEFAAAEDGSYGLSGITVVVPRDNACWLQTGCRLWMPKSGNRALILPRPESRGHFRLSPRELIHVDGKPADLEGGMRRADARLHELVRHGMVKPGQVEIIEVPIAA